MRQYRKLTYTEHVSNAKWIAEKSQEKLESSRQKFDNEVLHLTTNFTIRYFTSMSDNKAAIH
jgi:hypothetical protein